MIRDKRKDEQYFSSYIDYQNSRIRKKEEKLASCCNDASKRARVNLSLLNFRTDLLTAQYSAGYERKELLSCLHLAMDTACDMDSAGYENMLLMLSMAVMLDDDSAGRLIKAHEKAIYGDRLLGYLASFLSDGVGVWKGDFVVEGVYDGLISLEEAKDRTEAMLSYLDSWYEKHEGASWYGSDQRDTDTYTGYWSFESAAIARILKLDEQVLSKSEYYPEIPVR